MTTITVDPRLGPDWDAFAQEVARHLSGYSSLEIVRPEIEIEDGPRNMFMLRANKAGRNFLLPIAEYMATDSDRLDLARSVAQLLSQKAG